VRSIDTNIVVRWITRDDPKETPIADAVLQAPVFIPLTVLVEVAWVLAGRTYRYTPQMVHAAIDTLLRLDTVSVHPEDWVRWALQRQAAGADLPDMLHLVASRSTQSFVSFEKRLREHAGERPPVPVERAG
jgi:predicted nucleic-acid-binding protein